MEQLIEDARQNAQEEQEEQNDETIEDFGNPRIVVVGCGGAGNNTVSRLSRIGVDGAETIALNTDKNDLIHAEADHRVLIGKDRTKGLGAGGNPEVGRKSAQNSKAQIKELIGDADLVFVTAGMGGGTGTGASPVVCEVAKEQGAVVMAMVSTPFNAERQRLVKAREGLDRLQEHADSVVVLDNDRLLDYVPTESLKQAFSVMDQMIAETVKGISYTITQQSLVNLDYADMRSIMSGSGVSVMLFGEADSTNKVDEAVESAKSHALLDVDYEGASGALVHITGGPNLSIQEAHSVLDGITKNIRDDANMIWGARIDEESKNEVRVLAIMTGVDSNQLLSATSEKQADKAESPNSSHSSGLDTLR